MIPPVDEWNNQLKNVRVSTLFNLFGKIMLAGFLWWLAWAASVTIFALVIVAIVRK